jgi:hypothetical protein
MCDWTSKWNLSKETKSFPWPPKQEVKDSDVLQGCSESCSKICMFSRETYARLIHFAEANVSLGEQFLERLKADSLYPVVNLLYYEVRNDPSQVYLYNVKDFVEGTDQRLANLLAHIRDCVRNFGPSNVLI